MSAARHENPVFCALDIDSVDRALRIAREVSPHVGGFKVGLEFLHATGPEGLRAVVRLGLPVFADVKLHDIPNTVAGAVRALAPAGIAMLNVHASGGLAMMRAARDAARTVSPAPKVLGVTVLTSLDDADLAAAGIAGGTRLQAVRLAQLARSAGLDGIVCSPREVAGIRAACGPECLIVVPGVRPAGGVAGDQRRTGTPSETLAAGADILVVGRPITAAGDPAAAARAILEEARGTVGV